MNYYQVIVSCLLIYIDVEIIKISSSGVCGWTLEWLEDFLYDWSQVVDVSGVTSSHDAVTSDTWWRHRPRPFCTIHKRPALHLQIVKFNSLHMMSKPRKSSIAPKTGVCHNNVLQLFVIGLIRGFKLWL